MDTFALVDPEAAPLLAQIPRLELAADVLPALRAQRAALAAEVVQPEFPDLAEEERHIPGPEGDPEVRILVYRPHAVSGPLPALLWIHGGGYVLGSIDQDAVRSKILAREIAGVVVAVEYRLAPEHPFPAPVEDCYAALLWLYRQAGTLGVDPGRIAIGGASAGGGLAAALALLARDRGEVPLAFQLLIYPMVDDRTVTENTNPHIGEFIWTRASNRFGWSALLGREPGGPDVSPYAAARATNLAGLPPAWIGVGSLDLFLDEDIDYAQRLLHAGVPTELLVVPGGYHGWDGLAPQTASPQRFTQSRNDALRRALQPHGAVATA